MPFSLKIVLNLLQFACRIVINSFIIHSFYIVIRILHKDI